MNFQVGQTFKSPRKNIDGTTRSGSYNSQTYCKMTKTLAPKKEVFFKGFFSQYEQTRILLHPGIYIY